MQICHQKKINVFLIFIPFLVYNIVSNVKRTRPFDITDTKYRTVRTVRYLGNTYLTILQFS